jgi:anhydro-N-acetylmuramic acid kinase
MRVLGLMSGTSADGIDVALARISGAPPNLRARLENFITVPYLAPVRAAVLRIANGEETTTAEISQLNFLLGELFAAAALKACRRFHISPRSIALIGSHGQTIYHQGVPGPFLSAKRVASTLQIADPAVIAQRTGITTVADFRPADIAASGQGAPLVPFVDYLLYRDARRGRVALNIGGIANVTVIPAKARAKDVFAFDTGPGNMIVDGLVSHFSRGRQRYDRNARMAIRGRLLPELLAALLGHPYLRQIPPKTAGREQFGPAMTEMVLVWGRKNRARPEDLVRTATLLTPVSILDAFRRWIEPRTRVAQLIISGGGAHNPLMTTLLHAGLPGTDLVHSEDLGVPGDAKEAFAFAILAYEAYHGRPNNLPSATGAKQPAILGKIVRAPTR